MKKALWLLVGVAIGVVAAQRLGKSSQSQSQEGLGSLEARAREFGKTVADSYRARQAELRAAIGTPRDAADDYRN